MKKKQLSFSLKADGMRTCDKFVFGNKKLYEF